MRHHEQSRVSSVRRRNLILAMAVVTVILTSALSVATKVADSNAFEGLDRPGVAAHRGAAGLYPESTMVGFRHVVEDNPGTIIEFDVRPLKDGTLVVFHDATVDRVAVNATGKVVDMSQAEWGQLRIKHPTGGPSAPAATLAEVFDEFGGEHVPMFVELKDPAVADKFIETVWPFRNQIVVAAFDRATASRFARSGMDTMQLSVKEVDLIPGVTHVSLSNKNITAKFVQEAHAQGVEVWAWGDDVTGDTPSGDTRGIDGYIANDPRGQT